MYGLVNEAVQGLVIENRGEETWDNIKERANVDVEMFISHESYKDSLTYDLLVTASEIVNQPASKLLRLLGYYWITEIAVEHYGSMMDAGGKSFVEFMKNLPHFHRRVAMIFPNPEPPSFSILKEEENRLHLLHESTRGGLEMFVVGLLKALAKRHKIEIKIDHSKFKSDQPVEEVNQRLFIISWEPI
jgi:hypothetical protein